MLLQIPCPRRGVRVTFSLIGFVCLSVGGLVCGDEAHGLESDFVAPLVLVAGCVRVELWGWGRDERRSGADRSVAEPVCGLWLGLGGCEGQPGLCRLARSGPAVGSAPATTRATAGQMPRLERISACFMNVSRNGRGYSGCNGQARLTGRSFFGIRKPSPSRMLSSSRYDDQLSGRIRRGCRE